MYMSDFCKERKVNAKSVRMSNRVLQYVESFSGDGFNQKFESMVLYFMEYDSLLSAEIKEKENRLKAIDADIKLRRQILLDLQILEQRIISIRVYLDNIFRDV